VECAEGTAGSRPGLATECHSIALSVMICFETAIKAAQAGSVDGLKDFPSEKVLSERDDRGSSCLHWAAGNGHLGAVRYLVEQLAMPPDLIEGQS